VYLPEGNFYLMHTGELYRGPTTLDCVWRLDEIPLFVRAGSILPLADVTRRIGTRLPDPLVLAIYPGGNDTLDLYEDDGETPAYEQGAFSRWPISLRDEGGPRLTCESGPTAAAARRAAAVELGGPSAPGVGTSQPAGQRPIAPLTITLRPVVGDFAGRPKQRNVRMEVNFIDPPQSVTLGGQPLPAAQAAYDAEKRMLTVTLPALDTAKEHVVRVQ
jgi:hypothetical protein